MQKEHIMKSQSMDVLDGRKPPFWSPHHFLQDGECHPYYIHDIQHEIYACAINMSGTGYGHFNLEYLAGPSLVTQVSQADSLGIIPSEDWREKGGSGDRVSRGSQAVSVHGRRGHGGRNPGVFRSHNKVRV